MLEPIYRIEFFLDAIVNNTTPPEPIYRAEFYLAKIAGADVEIPEPVYRMEKYLAYLCGEEVELPDPIYRIEYYLAFLCGLNVELPEPIYRVEFWLWDWCGGGGIEKTVTGNPIHITDALAKPVQSLSVKLEPIQDLHGYDNPWPAGGGKNKWNGKFVATNFVELDTFSSPCYAGDNAMPITVGSTFTASIDGTAAGIRYVFLDSTFTAIGDAVNAVTTAAAPSNAVYLRWRIREEATADGKYQIEAGSTATSWTPYSNLCPISGHTDADVTRTGKNMIDMYGKDGSNIISKNVYLKAGTYTLSATGINGNYATYVRKATTEGSISGDIIANKVSAGNLTFTLSADTAIVVQWYCPNDSPSDLTGKTFQLELGSTASDYQPYVGTTYPIPLGTTVYGGTLDVTTGVLTVTMAIVDLGTLDWDLHGNTTIRQAWVAANTFRYKGAPDGNTAINALCDIAKAVSYNATWLPYTISTNTATTGAGLIFCVEPNKYASGDDFKTAMKGVQLCYELATPQTIQLTPTEVELLLGENNIWSDGEMTLVYLADGNASDAEALNILLGGRYVNNHTEDEPSDREALDILLGRTK